MSACVAGRGRGWGEEIDGTEHTAVLLPSEFGQAEAADMDASSAMDTSEPVKVRASMILWCIQG